MNFCTQNKMTIMLTGSLYKDTYVDAGAMKVPTGLFTLWCRNFLPTADAINSVINLIGAT